MKDDEAPATAELPETPYVTSSYNERHNRHSLGSIV